VEVNDGQANNNVTRRTFLLTVERVLADVSFASSAVKASDAGAVPVNLLTTQGAKEITVTFEAPAGYFSNAKLQELAPEVGVASVSLGASAGSLSTLQFKARPGKVLLGDKLLGKLAFATAGGKPSQFLTLKVLRINAKMADGSQVAKDVNYPARVAFVADQPLLEFQPQADGTRSLMLYGKPAATYAIEYASDFGAAAVWTRLPGQIPLSSLAAEIQSVSGTGSVGFYRAVQVQ
jgi:hypothetical protein